MEVLVVVVEVLSFIVQLPQLPSQSLDFSLEWIWICTVMLFSMVCFQMFLFQVLFNEFELFVMIWKCWLNCCFWLVFLCEIEGSVSPLTLTRTVNNITLQMRSLNANGMVSFVGGQWEVVGSFVVNVVNLTDSILHFNLGSNGQLTLSNTQFVGNGEIQLLSGTFRYVSIQLILNFQRNQILENNSKLMTYFCILLVWKRLLNILNNLSASRVIVDGADTLVVIDGVTYTSPPLLIQNSGL